MQCKDVMLTLVFDCKMSMTAEECAQLMRAEHIGFLPVSDGDGRLVGVVTDRDLVVRVMAQKRPPSTPIGEIMSGRPFLTCTPGDDLRALERRMAEERKSRAVVEDADGKIIGVISLSDIAQAERSAARTGKLLRDVTHRESVSIVRP